MLSVLVPQIIGRKQSYLDIEDIVSEYIHMQFEENKAIETSLSGFADLLTQRSLILKCALCSNFLQMNLPYQGNWVTMEFSFSGF